MKTEVVRRVAGMMVLAWAVLGLTMIAASGEIESDELVFIVAADMRNFASDGDSARNFSGALKAVKEAGPGAFLISPGDLDVDPPSATKEKISEALGEDYPWYPVIGNHEIESPSTMRYLRQYSTGLPKVVNRGPAGCAETNYSFDWADTHLVVLNIYCDGVKDWGLDGEAAPELLAWLDADLAATDKGHTFVIGHEPLISMPDMDNGRIRHQGDSLDENPKNAFALHQVMVRRGVDAYICGHTHNASYAVINGLWQLDAGHARGLEEKSYAEQMFAAITEAIAAGKARGVGESNSLRQLYRDDAYHIDKWFKYLGLDDGPVIQTLAQFADEYAHDPTAAERHYEAQIAGRQQARSTFLRVRVAGEGVTVEFHRDDARGGPYTLRRSVQLGATKEQAAGGR